MKARYELNEMNLTLSNVTLRDAAESYVLLKAIMKIKMNDIKLSHDQAEFLEEEFHELNLRRKGHTSEPLIQVQEEEEDIEYNLFSEDFFSENE